MPFPCCVACSKPRRYGSGRTIKSCASQPRRLTDRKSTRLNSSHSQISYAVFCLKKKNRTLVSSLRAVGDPPSGLLAFPAGLAVVADAALSELQSDQLKLTLLAIALILVVLLIGY